VTFTVSRHLDPVHPVCCGLCCWLLVYVPVLQVAGRQEDKGPVPDRSVGAAGECCFFDFRTYSYYVL